MNLRIARRLTVRPALPNHRGRRDHRAAVRSPIDTAALSAARFRLMLRAERRKTKPISNDAYYGDGHEEPLAPADPDARVKGAVVTRNHYGCRVLNASHTLFIDVDMGDASSPHACASTNVWDDAWQATLDDLCTVLASETGEGFRIYRTAAGFRVLATTREFEPANEASSRLMDDVGADADFVKLCRIQNCFRARLTPKPWRCGLRRPPNLFPRRTIEERSQFEHWLAEYDRACGDRATCRFLTHVGPATAHPRIEPIVEFHDRETKAFHDLRLS